MSLIKKFIIKKLQIINNKTVKNSSMDFYLKCSKVESTYIC